MNRSSPPKPAIAKVLAHFYGLGISATRGRQKVCCPLHADENPSASVDIDGNRWNCFVCNLSEDSWAIIMRERSCGFLEAQEFACAEFGGAGQAVSPDVPGESSRGVRDSPGPRRDGGKVRPGIRPFGSTWS
ncbi:CHC2 zinc finger domain-containing protein [Streptomyces sp. NPDC048281]|uniref:CHC2 zinc finger domain-containing protein n=1 Tax=Streptomyces sp. NPDC048281 TaxID=3154715 RepID=UPI003417E626